MTGRRSIAAASTPILPRDAADESEGPEAILARRQDAEGWRATIEHLPEPFREALVLRELEEFSYRR